MHKLTLTLLAGGAGLLLAAPALADGGVHHPECVTTYKDYPHTLDTPVAGLVYIKAGPNHYAAGWHEAGWDVPATWNGKDTSHYDVCADTPTTTVPPTTTEPPVTTLPPTTTEPPTTTTEAPPSTTTLPPTTASTAPPSTAPVASTTLPAVTTLPPTVSSTPVNTTVTPLPTSMAPLPIVDIINPPTTTVAPPKSADLPATGTQHTPYFALLGAGLLLLGRVTWKLARE